MAAAQARALGVQRGVLVLDVPKGSSAAQAGLRGSYRSTDGSVVLGDVITGINGDAVASEIDLFRAVDKYKPGDAVTLKVSRLSPQPGGGLMEEEVRLSVKLKAVDTA
jgi:S1-C subfamily serine protease